MRCRGCNRILREEELLEADLTAAPGDLCFICLGSALTDEANYQAEDFGDADDNILDKRL